MTASPQLFTASWNGSTWSPPVQQTDDPLGHRSPRVVYDGSNRPLVVWVAGGDLRLRNLSTRTQVSVTLPSEIGRPNEFELVQDSAGSLGAVFTAQGAPALGGDLFVAYYDQTSGVWGLPVRLTGDSAQEGYPTAALDSAGRLLVAYSSTELTSQSRTGAPHYCGVRLPAF